MIALLILVPWVLTVGALLFIMVHTRQKEEDEQEDFIDDSYDTIRVAVYEDRAYWVHDNTFYESDIVREPDFTTARPIDTMDLPSKELTRLLTILDELEESERD